MPWHVFAFHIVLPPEGQPKHWWADLLILDLVLGDILAKTANHIEAWYVHRRAVSDAEAKATGQKAGHIFQAHFQSPRDVACTLKDAVESHDAVRFLCEASVLVKLNLKVRNEEPTELPGQLDWDPLLRHGWFRYVSGLSATLLVLAQEARREQGWDPPADWTSADPKEIEAQYQQVHARVAKLWSSHWRDLNHHLRALLGYPEPPIEMVRLAGELSCL